MKVLVTGGGGFLGQYVVRAFLDRGDEVSVFSRNSYPALEALGVKSFQGDLSDFDAVNRAVAGTESVHHVAAQPGIWGPKSMYWIPNVTGTENVLRACRQQGVKRLVYTSSPSVVFGVEPHEAATEDLPYPDRYLCHYPESKAQAERLVLKAHEPGVLHTVSLRPHLIWGPGDRNLIPRVIDRARRGKLIQVGDGRNQVSIVYVENAAQAQLNADDALLQSRPKAGGQAYFIAQEEPVYLWDFLDQILRAMDIPGPSRRISYPVARKMGVAFELLYRLFFVRGEPPMTRFVAAQLGTSHWYCIDRAKADLGFSPSISTEEGIRRLVNDLRKP